MLKEKSPFVSIIVPALNEEQYVAECIESLLDIDYPAGSYEIIVVDNGSVDSTVSIVRSYPVKLLECRDVRVGAVRNFGVHHAKGEIIAFTDADCIVPRSWLRSAIDTMTQFDADAVGGICLLRGSPTWVETSWVVNPNPETGMASTLNGSSIVVCRDAFEQVGGFNESMNAGEDTDFADRLLRSGRRIYMSKESAMIHLGFPRTIGTFVQRQFWHASSALQRSGSWSVDKMNIASGIFLLIWIMTPFVTFYSFNAGAILFGIFLSMPAALTARRSLKSRFFSWRIDRYLTMYLLDFAYLLGRSLGFGRSALVIFGIVSDKKSYY
jgi:glycosyltransferase involved in cell wall biosynthesis